MRFRPSRPIRTALAATALAFAAPFAFAASPAQDTAPAEATRTEDASATTPSQEDAPLRRHHCLRSTGSLITASRNYRARRENKDERCAPVFGRVYTSEELRRTGYTDIGSALRALDPSIH